MSELRAAAKDERNAIRVYLDNNLLGPNAEDYKDEADALRRIEAGRSGERWLLEWVVSRRTANELEKTRDVVRREALRAAYTAATILEDDHTVKGFNDIDLGRWGYISNPMVADVPDEGLFAALREMGLDVMDARHLTVAIHNDCDVFLTMDGVLLKQRASITARYPRIDVLTPSQLWERLNREAIVNTRERGEST